jgi:hypothetical protein
MSQSSSDKFLYFTVGLLKGSEALEALRQDAVKHHMIDNPGQLIALRLTEYYESLSRGQGVATNEAERPRTEQRLADRTSATEWRSTPVPAPAIPTFEVSPTVTAAPAAPVAQPHAQPYKPQAAPTAQTATYAQPYAAPQAHSPAQSSSSGQSPQPSAYGSLQRNQVTGRMRALLRDGDGIVSTSTNADQNADEAADYWSTL